MSYIKLDTDEEKRNLIKRSVLSHIPLYGHNKIKNLFLQFLSKRIVNIVGLFIVPGQVHSTGIVID